MTNNFLSDGGDGFPAFTDGTGKYFGGLDIDAFADYLTANSPYTPARWTGSPTHAEARSRPACRAWVEHMFVLPSCPQAGVDTGFSTAGRTQS